MTRMRGLMAAAAAMALVTAPACGSEKEDGAPAPFTLRSSPEFVNRLIPGERPLALVTTEEVGGEQITLSASISLDGGTALLRPNRIVPGEVAEVWVTLPDVAGDVPFTVTVSGTNGGNDSSVEISATATPGVDDLATTATDIAALFIGELSGTVPGLPSTVDDLAGGTPVAGLLVVTHYAWFTEQYEIGVAWHVMVAPDDWADFYIRPRDALAPTVAYRLSSWSTALGGGEYSIVETTPPPEVTR